MARKASTQPGASTKAPKRGLNVPLDSGAEAKVRKLAKLTRLPLREVLAGLGVRLNQDINRLALDLGADSAKRHAAELKEIVDGEGGVEPVFAPPYRDSEGGA